ncbi:spidroin-2-like [Chamaea fasciata]|uniref:spidroin-2-like n=1 Tax=Chamaea fasciata TaxID=190680 RepID=UPI00336A836C
MVVWGFTAGPGGNRHGYEWGMQMLRGHRSPGGPVSPAASPPWGRHVCAAQPRARSPAVHTRVRAPTPGTREHGCLQPPGTGTPRERPPARATGQDTQRGPGPAPGRGRGAGAAAGRGGGGEEEEETRPQRPGPRGPPAPPRRHRRVRDRAGPGRAGPGWRVGGWADGRAAAPPAPGNLRETLAREGPRRAGPGRAAAGRAGPWRTGRGRAERCLSAGPGGIPPERRNAGLPPPGPRRVSDRARRQCGGAGGGRGRPRREPAGRGRDPRPPVSHACFPTVSRECP